MRPQTVSTPAHRKRTPSGGLIWISSNQRPCGVNAGTVSLASLFDWLRSGLLHQLLVIAHTNLSPSPRIRMLAPARYGCPHGGVPVAGKNSRSLRGCPLSCFVPVPPPALINQRVLSIDPLRSDCVETRARPLYIVGMVCGVNCDADNCGGPGEGETTKGSSKETRFWGSTNLTELRIEN
jgi:hypothetical protein